MAKRFHIYQKDIYIYINTHINIHPTDAPKRVELREDGRGEQPALHAQRRVLAVWVEGGGGGGVEI